MAAMSRTVCTDRTSWGVPLMGRSDVRTGRCGQRRRSTRTAAGAQLLDHSSVGDDLARVAVGLVQR